MKRHELEHIIRAAGTIAQTDELVILGSQAILGSVPDPPAELTTSVEVDTYPLHDPHKGDLIDGSIGEMSPFHQEFSYYAHGVGPETATLPSGWRKRLVKLLNENTRGITGLCLHPIDIALSKLVAAREKDHAFVCAMLKHGLLDPAKAIPAVSELPEDTQADVLHRLNMCISAR